MLMPKVDAAPLIDAEREARQAGIGRRHLDQEAAAHRLRARGFSYRRIAETLRIRYDVVSRWLYGAPAKPAAAPAPPLPASAATPPPVPPPAAAPALPPTAPAVVAAGDASLAPLPVEARLAELDARLSRFQAEALRREERLLAEIAGLRDALESFLAAEPARARPRAWERA